MDFKLVFVLGCMFLAGLATADEFRNYEYSQDDETQAAINKQAMIDGQLKMEDQNSETSMALTTQSDESDPDSIKHKGFCHWGIAVWFRPGVNVRCNCMRCTCKTGGNWDCNYHFPFCPYYYCSNSIYNPSTQVCCCGKTFDKKANWACCGYSYYDTASSKCCNYFSVKPKKAACPRFKI